MTLQIYRMMLFYFLLVLFALLLLKKFLLHTPKVPDNLKVVPRVAYELPYFGHGIGFSKNIMGFLQNCCHQYGKVFSIKIFLKRFCVICDKNLVKEFFKQKENEMSMYDNLKGIFFDYAFSDDGTNLERIINLNKKIVVDFENFLPKIVEEAEKMTGSLHGTQNLTPIIIKFVARTSARCFLNISLTDAIYDSLVKYTLLLNRITVMTYFVPKWILVQTVGRWLSYHRKQLRELIKPYIVEYREQNKNDSLIIRHCLNQEDPMTDDQIADVIICLLYVSSENTALGAVASIVDFIQNPLYLEKLRAEILLNNTPEAMKQMVRSQDNLLHHCILESARMNSHVFALTRIPKTVKNIGDYYVGDMEHVALCEPLLMSYEMAEDTFHNPTQFYPERYVEKPSLKSPENVMTWGAGSHLCPGKLFAIYEIKMAIIKMLTKYDITILDLPKLDYFSPSAFAERENIKITIEPSFYYDNHVLIQKVGCGYLLRNYLSEERQKALYEHMIDVSKGSLEYQIIQTNESPNGYPICMWNNVYTSSSNCTEPSKFIELGHEIILHYPYMLPIKKVNSVYGQLFGQEGVMKDHCDQYVNYGISINLGASTVFRFGSSQVVLNSGDIFVADFASNIHGVRQILPNAPKWFHQVENFGRVRCSIQLRNTLEATNEKITDAEFKELLQY